MTDCMSCKYLEIELVLPKRTTTSDFYDIYCSVCDGSVYFQGGYLCIPLSCAYYKKR